MSKIIIYECRKCSVQSNNFVMQYNNKDPVLMFIPVLYSIINSRGIVSFTDRNILLTVAFILCQNHKHLFILKLPSYIKIL